MASVRAWAARALGDGPGMFASGESGCDGAESVVVVVVGGDGERLRGGEADNAGAALGVGGICVRKGEVSHASGCR